MKSYKIIRTVREADGTETAAQTITTKTTEQAAADYLERLAQLAQSRPRFERVKLYAHTMTAREHSGRIFKFAIK